MKYSSVIIRQDDALAYRFSVSDFDLDRWTADKKSQILTGGRGGSVKIILDDQPCVLRKYLRGGWMQNLLVDRYFWTGLENCRAYREHRVVEHALSHGLPVPTVLAYCISRTGIFYRSSIISRFIDNQGTLAAYLTGQMLSSDDWSRLGRLINQMHLAGIDHADLNSNNILIDDEMNFFLIDFDKASIRLKPGAWCRRNIERLLRSLAKISASTRDQGQSFHFNDNDWQSFLSGYR